MTTHHGGPTASDHEPGLPAWAIVGHPRSQHILRVVELLSKWATQLALPTSEVEIWRAAGLFHDALRDAPESLLRTIVPESALPHSLLHGPAAAKKLEESAYAHVDVIDAVRYHTTGRATWCAAGRALYCADYLESGRSYLTSEDHELRERFSVDHEAVFSMVVARRLARAVNRRSEIHPLTVEMWNEVVHRAEAVQ